MWRQMYWPLMVLALGMVVTSGQQALARDDDVVKDINHAWVKLFDDRDYTGERLSINYPKNSSDMRRMSSDKGDRGVSNMVQSAHFQIPKGWALRLYADTNYHGKHLDLAGTGRPEKEPLTGLGNKVSSFKWVHTDSNRD